MFAALAYVRHATAGLPRAFWYLWAGTLINRIGIFVQPFLTLFLTSQRGLTPQDAALVVSLQGFGSLVAHLFGGYLTDRLGRRATMMLSFFGTPVLMLLLYASQSLALIALLSLMFGFFIDLYRPASSALIADVVPPEDRVRAYALRYWAINLGAAIGLALAGFLATRGYVLLFVGDALTTALFGLVVLRFIPETRPTPDLAKHTADPSSAFSVPWERRTLIFTVVFSLISTLFGVIFSQMNVTLPLAMKQRGLTELDFGLASAVNGLVIVLVSLPLNQFLRRHPALSVMAASAVVAGIGFGLNVVATTLPAYALSVAIWTLGELMAAPLGTTLIANISPAAQRGRYQGIYGASWGLANVFGPALGGSIYQYYGADMIWWVCLALGLVVAGGYLWVCRPLYDPIIAQGATHP